VSESSRNDAIWLGVLCTLLVLILLPYYAYSAMLLLIQQEWGMSSAEAGFVFGATQIGYVASVIFLVPLTDRVKTSYILAGSAALCVLGNALFPLLSNDIVSGSILRAIGGAGVAGTYMPGIRLISERFSGNRRGGAVGMYVAAFTLGGAVSFAGTGVLLPILGWRGAYLALSLVGILSLGMALAMVRTEKPKVRSSRGAQGSGPSLLAVLRNKPILLVTAGYSAHVWELYGMRAWTAPFLASLLVGAGGDLTSSIAQSGAISSLVLLVGVLSTAIAGGVSDRWGRTVTAGTILGVSSVLSLLIGWLGGAPFWVVIAICLLYGFWVPADSPVYSTGVTELAPQERLGTAMAVQSVTGFTAGLISPVLFGVILDTSPEGVGWGLSFGMLGLAALVGVASMVALRRRPESKLLAGGKG